MDNFFTIDFNLEELKTLKRRQVRPGRDPNYDFQYSFVDFDEFVSIAKSKGVGIAPEIKTPTAINKVITQYLCSTTLSNDTFFDIYTEFCRFGSRSYALIEKKAFWYILGKSFMNDSVN